MFSSYVRPPSGSGATATGAGAATGGVGSATASPVIASGSKRFYKQNFDENAHIYQKGLTLVEGGESEEEAEEDNDTVNGEENKTLLGEEQTPGR